MRIHFVSFATPSFRARQWLLEKSAAWVGGADVIETWNPKRLIEDGFRNRHADLFPGSKGFGWYAWKPYIILKAIEAAAEGDLIVYQDVGRKEPLLIQNHLSFWKSYLETNQQDCLPGVLIPFWGPNNIWTKKQAMEMLGLTDPKYRENPQVQASWSVWIKSPASIEFVNHWATACTQLDLVGGHLIDGPEGEVEGFVEHRWDQSLLTLLTWRDNLKPLDQLPQRIPELNEKSCGSWMKYLKAPPAAKTKTLPIATAATAYHGLETLMKLGFKRREVQKS